jgi:hypothetical protein
MNLTFDLPNVVGTHPRKARESRVREMARRGRDMARTRSGLGRTRPTEDPYRGVLPGHALPLGDEKA